METRGEAAEPVRFQPGDPVQVRVDSPPHHIRTPAYIQGKTGRVEALCGVFLNPESLAYGGSGLPKQPLYRVQFDQTEVWESYRGSEIDQLLIDIYQHWLEPAAD